MTATMNGVGLGLYSALPLLALTGLCWLMQKFSRREFGLTWAAGREFGWAMGDPLAVLGLGANLVLLLALMRRPAPPQRPWRA